MAMIRNAYKMFVEKLDGKVPHGTFRSKWMENTVEIDLK
jgi:hypothetical protein